MDWPKPPENRNAKASLLSFVRVDPGREHLSPVAYYRGYQPAMMIGMFDRYFNSEVWTQMDVGRLINFSPGGADRVLVGRDIYIISRLYQRDGLDRFLDIIHEGGGLVVFDTDDDLTEEFRDLDSRGGEFVYTMKHMDAVTVSTPFLACRMEEHIGYRPEVLPNHIDCHWFKQVSMLGKRKFNGLTVGLVGTSSHYDDWVYPVEALKQLKEKHSDAVTILVAGYFPDYLDDVALKVAPVPYSQYPVLMRQFDIVCCSLDPDDMFNKSKSAIKALESMAAARKVNGKIGGAVPVCTDMPVYRRVVNGSNGVLTSNDNWFEVLDRLVTDDILRQKLSVQGHKWVNKHRNSRIGYRRWARFYRQLLRRK